MKFEPEKFSKYLCNKKTLLKSVLDPWKAF